MDSEGTADFSTIGFRCEPPFTRGHEIEVRPRGAESDELLWRRLSHEGTCENQQRLMLTDRQGRVLRSLLARVHVRPSTGSPALLDVPVYRLVLDAGLIQKVSLEWAGGIPDDGRP